MFRLYKIPIGLIIILIFASCDSIGGNKKSENLSIDDFRRVEIKNEYSLLLPKYLSKATNLNADASLQYQHLIKEAYVIVIDEPKDELIKSFKDSGVYIDSLHPLETYSKYQDDYLKQSISDTIFDSGFSDKMIGKLKAKMKTIHVRIDEMNVDIAYWNAYIESDENMYTVMCWTLADRNLKYDKTFRRVLNSFEVKK